MTDREVIRIDSDSDEDEDLRRAIALSLQDQGGTPPQPTYAPSDDAAKQPIPDSEQSSNATTGLLALDRKQMEQERLQRLAKRRRLSNGTNAQPSQPPAKRQATAETTIPSPLRFPKGAVKRTWTRGYQRTSDDITIEEVFQKDELQLAILSSFQWDEEWMLSKLDFPRTKLMLLAFAASEDQERQMQDNVPTNIRFCFPPMKGPGSMHSKLQILKYHSHLRIVVPTGNLVPYDWGETGVMENMLYLIDIPRLDGQITPSPTSETRFSKDLCRFLSAAGVDDKMINSLSRYDFSATADVGFVYTIPGSHTDESRDRVGYCGLGSSVRALALASGGSSQVDVDFDVDVDVACASLGAVNCDFITAIHNACKGDNGMKEYSKRMARKPSASKETHPSKHLRDRFRIYFPANKTVTGSKGGTQAAGTVCLQARWWRSPTFPRELVRDCVNNRPGLLMHTKVMFVRKVETASESASASTVTGASQSSSKAPPPQSEALRTGSVTARSATGPPQGWAYVGSANLSESAWGKMTKDMATGKPKMTCRNWECGVVLLASEATGTGQAAAAAADDGMRIFSGVVPVPMAVPGRVYEEGELPWFFAGDN